jgi:hypothetical protein
MSRQAALKPAVIEEATMHNRNRTIMTAMHNNVPRGRSVLEDVRRGICVIRTECHSQFVLDHHD